MSSSNNRPVHRLLRTCLPAFILLVALPTPPAIADADPEHHAEIGARVRYTQVKEGERDGRATSIKIRAALDSRWTQLYSTLLEVDGVATGLQDSHSDGVRFNGKPIIPDVPGAEINQAWLRWQSGQWQFTGGRQRLEWDNQRFLGSVDSWQNDQTFDAIAAGYRFLFQSRLRYAYIGNVNRPWGDDADESLEHSSSLYDAWDGVRPPAWWGDHRHNTHLLQAEFREWDYLSALVHYQHIDNRDLPSDSNNTLGAGLRFKFKPGNIKYLTEFDAALQQRTQLSDSPTTHYYRLQAGLEWRSAEFSLQQEVLSSSDNIAFITPLGSNDKFQGWAEVFYRTPNGGIVDTRAQLDWRIHPWRIDLRYHQFDSEASGDALGSEVDLDLIFRITKKQTLWLRLADFNADHPGEEDVSRATVNWSYGL